MLISNKKVLQEQNHKTGRLERFHSDYVLGGRDTIRAMNYVEQKVAEGVKFFNHDDERETMKYFAFIKYKTPDSYIMFEALPLPPRSYLETGIPYPRCVLIMLETETDQPIPNNEEILEYVKKFNSDFHTVSVIDERIFFNSITETEKKDEQT